MPKTKISFSITPASGLLRKILCFLFSILLVLFAAGLLVSSLQPVPQTSDFLSGQEVRFDGWWIKPVNGPACVFFSDESLTELANRVEGYSNRWTNYRTTQGPSGLLIDRQTSDGKMTHACFIRIPELVFGQPAYWFHNFSATFRSSDGAKTLSIPLPYHLMATSSVLNPYGGDLSFGTRYAAFASKKEFISFYQDWRAIHNLNPNSLTVEEDSMVLRGGFVQDEEWGTAVRITFEEGEGETLPFTVTFES